MSDAVITTMIVDGVLTSGMEFKIFEFGRGILQSGLSGYTELYHTNPIKEFVVPLWERLGLDVWHRTIDEDNDIYGCLVAPDFKNSALPDNRESIDRYSGIYLSPYVSDACGLAFRKSAFLPYDGHGLMRGIYSDKSYLAAILAPMAPEIFPCQKAYPVKRVFYNHVDVSAILDDFTGERVVIKAPRMSGGKGVAIVQAQDLKQWFNKRVGSFLWSHMLSLPRHDSVIVQELVSGVRIDTDVGQSSPTARILLTAVHSDGETSIYPHMAYYKLPAEAAGDEQTYGNVVSQISQGGSRKVPDDHRQAMFDDLQANLRPALHRIFKKSTSETALEMLQSPDPARQHVGFLLALDTSIMDHHGDGQYPELLKEPILSYAAAHPDLVKRSYKRMVHHLTQD